MRHCAPTNGMGGIRRTASGSSATTASRLTAGHKRRYWWSPSRRCDPTVDTRRDGARRLFHVLLPLAPRPSALSSWLEPWRGTLDIFRNRVATREGSRREDEASNRGSAHARGRRTASAYDHGRGGSLHWLTFGGIRWAPGRHAAAARRTPRRRPDPPPRHPAARTRPATFC